ncbi:uncharacterized protein LOC144584249 [Pogona vitticeps]
MAEISVFSTFIPTTILLREGGGGGGGGGDGGGGGWQPASQACEPACKPAGATAASSSKQASSWGPWQVISRLKPPKSASLKMNPVPSRAENQKTRYCPRGSEMGEDTSERSIEFLSTGK